MSKVVVFLADGFEECEALIVVDILRRAGIETEMASVMGRKEVLSSRKIWCSCRVVGSGSRTWREVRK